MAELYKIEGENLEKVPSGKLAYESLLERWVSNDLGLLGLEAVLIGQQVRTGQNKIIDLLAVDSSGGLVIVELKKHRTQRETVAQVLDYASWVRQLTAAEIRDLAERNRGKSLGALFRDELQLSEPSRLNDSHSMLIVASKMDKDLRRIVEYLSDAHNVGINTVCFNVFEEDGQQWIATESLLDQEEVTERIGRKALAPWDGRHWYVIVQSDASEDKRSWKDMKKFGFISAGGGRIYGRRLGYLKIGDRIFAHWPKKGYVGYGVVTSERQLASRFRTEQGLLFDQDLDKPEIKEDVENSELAQYAVGIDWKATVDAEHGVWEQGLFANPSTVCKLRDQSTIDILLERFGLDSEEND